MPPGSEHSTAQRSTSWDLGPRARIWFGGHNPAAKRAMASLVTSNGRPPQGPLDAVVITPKTIDEAVYFAAKLRPRLAAGGACWVVCPQQSNADDVACDNEQLTVALAECGFDHLGDVAIDAGFSASRYALSATPNEVPASRNQSSR